MTTLAIDFGTSNSAAAVLEAGAVRRIALEPGADTLPTAVFFPTEGGPFIGREAARALIDGEEGRYMRALKSVLGTALFHEARPLGGKRRTLAEVVTAFLAEVKARAEAETGARFTKVLSGRPVHFHSDDAERDARAEADLRACYRAAGFEAVDFLHEPEAAALAGAGKAREGETGLVVDIGGGTSDFSVFRQEADGVVRVLASHGIRLGGTDFDQALSLAEAMPLLGLGGELNRTFGEGRLPVPKAIYVDLATWARIPFLYTRETERAVDDLYRHAVEPEALARLVTVIQERLGHDLAFAVEAGKIGANGGARAVIDLGMIEPGLAHPITPGALAAALAQYRDALQGALYAVLVQAGVAPGEIGTILLVGGSSLMAMIPQIATAICPGARIERANAFTAVVDGLALAAAP